jgi:hypothetical protein
MAKRLQLPPFGQRIETRVLDDYGHPIAVIPYSSAYEPADQGGFNEVKRADHLVRAERAIRNPSHAARQGEPLLIAVCHYGRSPGIGLGFRSDPVSAGLITLQNAKACVRCGHTTCPWHRKTNGGKARCLPCARRRWLWKLIKPLFFSTRDRGITHERVVRMATAPGHRDLSPPSPP